MHLHSAVLPLDSLRGWGINNIVILVLGADWVCYKSTGGKRVLATELGITIFLKFLMKIPYAYLIIANVVEFSTGSEMVERRDKLCVLHFFLKKIEFSINLIWSEKWDEENTKCFSASWSYYLQMPCNMNLKSFPKWLFHFLNVG